MAVRGFPEAVSFVSGEPLLAEVEQAAKDVLAERRTGRVLSFLVTLGVAYPLSALAQGPVADQTGVGWMTAGSALLLVLACGLLAPLRPGVLRVLAIEPAACPDKPEQAADSSPAGQAGVILSV